MSTGIIPLNQWTHVVFINNGTNTQGYLNGAGGTLGTGGSFHVGTAALEIGRLYI